MLDLNNREAGSLSPVATLSSEGVRRMQEARLERGYRQAFSLDADRILHSMAYTRYIDKTQVFYLTQNDHITHRVLHVQLVSKIARTIGRFLGLNEDLIEAIALGHDIGHTPFGHDGEHFLSELCRSNGIGYFHHNLQSVQFLDKVERKGVGWNLCLQTLDGILCHDGEVHTRALTPEKEKTFQTLENETADKKVGPDKKLLPMTLEGCVVRMADTISYIGRDIEDAIRLGYIDRSDLPPESVATLGKTNGTIVYHLVTDIIENSSEKPHVCFSEGVSEALVRLKQFNLERIYLNPKVKMHLEVIHTLFKMLFERYSNDIVERHNRYEIVRDFIAGMTDQYFMRQCPESMRPRPIS
jgi:dGTPase